VNPSVLLCVEVQTSMSFGRSWFPDVIGLIWTLATSALWREKNENTISCGCTPSAANQPGLGVVATRFIRAPVGG
jgi:hypothetical protein